MNVLFYFTLVNAKQFHKSKGDIWYEEDETLSLQSFPMLANARRLYHSKRKISGGEWVKIYLLNPFPAEDVFYCLPLANANDFPRKEEISSWIRLNLLISYHSRVTTFIGCQVCRFIS